MSRAPLDRRPVGSVSLDLDNLWSYMKTHGDPGWELFPSYLDLVVPRVLAFFERKGWRVTVFVVGQDAVLDFNREAFEALGRSGHEIGNHSFHHEPWMHRRPPQEIEAEILRAEQAIEGATGSRPSGYRGPGFSVSNEVLEVLAARGYGYDASTFPTYLGPLARAWYFLRSRSFDDQEKRDRSTLFGRFRDGWQPNRPFVWRFGEGSKEDRSLIELPVTTFPGFHVPMHVSYLDYLANFTRASARAYFATGLELCRLSGIEPSLLLHPLDFLGRDDDLEPLAFFPCMNRPVAWKLRVLEGFLDQFARRFRVVGTAEHAAEVARRNPRSRSTSRLRAA